MDLRTDIRLGRVVNFRSRIPWYLSSEVKAPIELVSTEGYTMRLWYCVATSIVAMLRYGH